MVAGAWRIHFANTSGLVFYAARMLSTLGKITLFLIPTEQSTDKLESITNHSSEKSKTLLGSSPLKVAPRA
ncbi:MAG: hypothetical protein STSR0007_01380 [Thermovirga sp.]